MVVPYVKSAGQYVHALIKVTGIMLNFETTGPIGMCDICIGAYTLGVTRTRGNTSCSVCVYFIVKV